jgi:hypothetical protein
LDGGNRLTIRGSATSEALACQLIDDKGSPRYAAQLMMAAVPSGRPLRRSPDAGKWPWPLDALYLQSAPARLFHGPAFRVLRSLDWLAPDGGAATLVGTAEAGWNGEPWVLDVAALDGALQLAILWGFTLSGRPSLPTGLGRLTAGRLSRAGERLCCTVQSRSRSPSRFTCDLWVESGEELLAELLDVEMHFRQPEAEP